MTLSLLLLILFHSSFTRTTTNAHVTCTTDEECIQAYRTGSECVEGRCSNPFHKGGCLQQVLPSWQKKRVCHSEDPPDAAAKGACRRPLIEYPEIRILGQNWESPFFQAWILQIVLQEMLDVPVTLETGVAGKGLDFYGQDMPFDYGLGYSWDGLKLANEVGDCRLVVQPGRSASDTTDERELRRSVGPEYKPCAHVIPEVWEGPAATVKELEQAGVIEPAQGMGALGHLSWFIPKFTGEKDLTLFTYMGLQGEENRRKLAEMFLRPTSWKDYCLFVSSDGCATPDNVTARAPADASEESRMFVEGLYTGHFRKTEQNDCEINPTTCTGHIVDFPCGWSSSVKQQTHHLGIALESNGPEPVSGGYSYGQMTEIWAAANATKSDVLMLWWTPEALYQQYLGTDAEFHRINLPPPSQACVDARVGSVARCEAETEGERIGEAVGSCDYSPVPLHRLVTSNLYSLSYDSSKTPGEQSPAYDTIKAFSFSGLQIGDIFERWNARGVDKWNYDPRDAVCTWAADNIELLQALIPRTFPRVVQESEAESRDVLFYIAVVAGGSAVFLVILCIYGTYKNRKKRALVFAQVEFLWLLLSGLLMVSLGSLMRAIPPSNPICTSVVWLVNLGYTMELVPLIVKVAAINRVMMAARRMKRVVLKHSTLFGIVFLLSTIMVAFLTFWTVLDKPHQSIDYFLTDSETDSGDTIVLAASYCTSDSQVWKYVSTGWYSVLLLSATVLAFQTRKIQHDVNESQVLAIMIYSHFFFVVLQIIVFMLEQVLQVYETARYQSLVGSADVIATCCIYFLPKFAAKETPFAERRSTFVSGHSSTPDTENPLGRSNHFSAERSTNSLHASSHHRENGPAGVSKACQQAIDELSEDLSSSSEGSGFANDATRDDAHKLGVPVQLECYPQEPQKKIPSEFGDACCSSKGQTGGPAKGDSNDEDTGTNPPQQNVVNYFI